MGGFVIGLNWGDSNSRDYSSIGFHHIKISDVTLFLYRQYLLLRPRINTEVHYVSNEKYLDFKRSLTLFKYIAKTHNVKHKTRDEIDCLKKKCYWSHESSLTCLHL